MPLELKEKSNFKRGTFRFLKRSYRGVVLMFYQMFHQSLHADMALTGRLAPSGLSTAAASLSAFLSPEVGRMCLYEFLSTGYHKVPSEHPPFYHT